METCVDVGCGRASRRDLTAPSADAETLRVGKAGRDAFSFVPADIGAQTGLFKKHGIDVEISSFGGDARVQQAMTADGIDIGLGSGPGLAFIVKGSPVKGIAAMADPPLTFALVVRKDGEIKTLDDLKGKKVGVSTVGSVTGWLVGETARAQGLGLRRHDADADRRRRLAGRGGQDQVDRRCGGQSRGRVQLRAARRRPYPAAVRRSAEGFPRPRDFRDRQGDRRQARGAAGVPGRLVRDHRFMRKDKAKTVEIAAQVMDTDEPTAARIYDDMMPMFNDDGRFKPKALAVLSRSFVDMKTLPEEPDMRKLINESFLPK